MDTMPSDVKDIFEELQTEITWLHGRWIIYRQLFGHSERRVELLNACASAFFYIIQDILLNDIQVSLSKLTDPARTGKYDNLSLEQLQERIEATGDEQLAGRLRQLLNTLHDKCQAFRIRRNKRLAHLDLITAMQKGANSLPPISRQMIADALEIIREYMNVIDGHYCDNETVYEDFMMLSDGEALLTWLKHGLRYEELLQEQKVSWDDLQQSAWKDV
jgi:hypothetical protein